MSTELKPCPFCGAELVEVETFSTHTVQAFVHPLDPPCVLAATWVHVPRYAALSTVEEQAFERVRLWNQRQ